MTVVLELAPAVEQLAKAKAEARGVSLEEYLPDLVARALQQQEWNEDVPAVPTGTCICSMRRIWDTPEEDAAWKYLEDL